MENNDNWQFDYASEEDMYNSPFSLEEMENYLSKNSKKKRVSLYCILFHKPTEDSLTIFGAENRFIVECWTGKHLVFSQKTLIQATTLIYNYPELNENLAVFENEIMSLKDVLKIAEYFYQTRKTHQDYVLEEKSYIYEKK